MKAIKESANSCPRGGIVSVQAEGQPAGKHLGREGAGGPGGHQVEQEPAMFPCSKGGQRCLGLH